MLPNDYTLYIRRDELLREANHVHLAKIAQTQQSRGARIGQHLLALGAWLTIPHDAETDTCFTTQDAAGHTVTICVAQAA